MFLFLTAAVDGARAGEVYLSFFEMYQFSEASACIDDDNEEE
jgi:hypothetical protein